MWEQKLKNVGTVSGEMRKRARKFWLRKREKEMKKKRGKIKRGEKDEERELENVIKKERERDEEREREIMWGERQRKWITKLD